MGAQWNNVPGNAKVLRGDRIISVNGQREVTAIANSLHERKLQFEVERWMDSSSGSPATPAAPQVAAPVVPPAVSPPMSGASQMPAPAAAVAAPVTAPVAAPAMAPVTAPMAATMAPKTSPPPQFSAAAPARSVAAA